MVLLGVTVLLLVTKIDRIDGNIHDDVRNAPYSTALDEVLKLCILAKFLVNTHYELKYNKPIHIYATTYCITVVI